MHRAVLILKIGGLSLLLSLGDKVQGRGGTCMSILSPADSGPLCLCKIWFY